MPTSINDPAKTWSDAAKTYVIDRDLLLRKIEEDPSIDTPDLILSKGKTIFDNATPSIINQPFSETKMDLSDEFWDFKISNGLQSLKRGYFQIVTEPKIRIIDGVETISAYTLFNAGNNLDKHHLYFANVGTLVNRYAIAGSLITNSPVYLPRQDQKMNFLSQLRNKTIYVTRAEFVHDATYGRMKEIIWYKLH